MMVKKILTLGAVVVVLGWMAVSGAQANSPPAQEDGREYVVQAEDWLSKLADKYLGDGNLYPQIVAATNARAATDSRLTIIENPNLISPGQILFIPTGDTPLPIVSEPIATGSSLDILCRDQHPTVQAFCTAIPIAQIHFDPYEESEFFTCASRAGLANTWPDPRAVTIYIPNDGDFDLNGIVTSVKLTPERALLIPRWPGSKFDFPAEFADKYGLPVGEQLEIPLARAFQMIKAGDLIWTGMHGEPGRAGLFQTAPPLTCDPQADFEIVIGPF